MSLAYFDRNPNLRAPFRFTLIALVVLALTTVLLNADLWHSARPHHWLIYIPLFALPILNAIFVIPVAQRESKKRGA